MRTETKEVVALKSQVLKLENKVNEIIITTAEENALATDLKAKLNETKKQIKARKEEITKPLNAALSSARALFAPIEEQFEKAEKILGDKLIAYKQKIEAEIKEAEAKIAARVERGTIKIETAEKKIGQLPIVQKTIQTNHGKVQFRKIQKMRIIDENLIPDKYWIIDQILLRKEVLAGVVVPGAEKFEEEIV